MIQMIISQIQQAHGPDFRKVGKSVLQTFSLKTEKWKVFKIL